MTIERKKRRERSIKTHIHNHVQMNNYGRMNTFIVNRDKMVQLFLGVDNNVTFVDIV